jgi:hypothetical protein
MTLSLLFLTLLSVMLSLLINRSCGQANSSFVEFPAMYQLPAAISGHFSFVESSVLYVFGGRVDTTTFNYNIYSLDLGSMAMSLNGAQNDIAIGGSASWQTAPMGMANYGDIQDGGWYCEGQCSVVIKGYMYIIGAESSGTSDSYNMYKLDLATRLFEGVSGTYTGTVPSLLTSTSGMNGACVTGHPASNVIYVIGGANGLFYSLYMHSFNVTTNQWTKLRNNKQPYLQNAEGRVAASCVVSHTGDYVYLLGGEGNYNPAYFGMAQIAIYDVNANSWDDGGWSTSNAAGYHMAFPRLQAQCAMNPFINIVYCPSSKGIVGGNTNALIPYIEYWDTKTKISYGNTSTVALPVYLYSLTTYELIAQAVGVYVTIITGGRTDPNSQTTETNITQYMLAVQGLTDSPTESPTGDPTYLPTADPTQLPTYLPSSSPTTGMPTETPTGTPTTEPISGNTVQTPRPTEKPTHKESDAVRVLFQFPLSMFTTITLAVCWLIIL